MRDNFKNIEAEENLLQGDDQECEDQQNVEEPCSENEKFKKKKHQNVKELEERVAELTDKYVRLSAEFDNYRKRTLRERMDLTKMAGEQILSGILPVVDNFERALVSMDSTTDVAALKEGVDLIYIDFKDFLAKNGVKEIKSTNSDFDTDLHEAMTTIPAPTPELKGKVVDTIEKGYTLNDKVIRFARVVVGE